jgi:hypothetical protein
MTSPQAYPGRVLLLSLWLIYQSCARYYGRDADTKYQALQVSKDFTKIE